jgi:hypothetical protein
MQEFDKVFAPKDVISIKEITKKQRARGRSWIQKPNMWKSFKYLWLA